MADIELPARDAPDYKEKLSEKRRALMAITRQKKKDNAIILYIYLNTMGQYLF